MRIAADAAPLPFSAALAAADDRNMQARIISVLILGIPYLALSLIAVFLQNNFFNWTIKGIVIGVLTVVLLLLAGFAFKKIEAIIAKHIEEKMK